MLTVNLELNRNHNSVLMMKSKVMENQNLHTVTSLLTNLHQSQSNRIAKKIRKFQLQ